MMKKRFVELDIDGQKFVICPNDIMRIKFHRSFLNIGCRECDMHLHICIYMTSGTILEFKIFINEERNILVENIDALALDYISELLDEALFIVIDSKWGRHFINMDKVECCLQSKDEYTFIFDNKIRICINISTKVLNYFT